MSILMSNIWATCQTLTCTPLITTVASGAWSSSSARLGRSCGCIVCIRICDISPRSARRLNETVNKQDLRKGVSRYG
ncbi:hypothetical protein B0H63DRAFT_472071 [Podospora didyma]|uniref:Uncharacterized protein n=1 Tax=Podospora didyma TaxID=330526 RepID=A0AAE0TZE6_9PEZI|nr:hypothetical protein B0H63DRAFT_472071 [Podospora didyma]